MIFDHFMLTYQQDENIVTSNYRLDGSESITNLSNINDIDTTPIRVVSLNYNSTPVPLTNIGNTCYINTVLQFLFSFNHNIQLWTLDI